MGSYQLSHFIRDRPQWGPTLTANTRVLQGWTVYWASSSTPMTVPAPNVTSLMNCEIVSLHYLTVRLQVQKFIQQVRQLISPYPTLQIETQRHCWQCILDTAGRCLSSQPAPHPTGPWTEIQSYMLQGGWWGQGPYGDELDFGTLPMIDRFAKTKLIANWEITMLQRSKKRNKSRNKLWNGHKNETGNHFGIYFKISTFKFKPFPKMLLLIA